MKGILAATISVTGIKSAFFEGMLPDRCPLAFAEYLRSVKRLNHTVDTYL